LLSVNYTENNDRMAEGTDKLIDQMIALWEPPKGTTARRARSLQGVQPPEAAGPLGLIWGADRIAIALGVSERRAFRLLEKGEIPAKKVGGRWVADREALKQFFSDRSDARRSSRGDAT
jgi:hypothetical protein